MLLTENHQIMFATNAYLAGQIYPDRIFTNSNQTGREKQGTIQAANHEVAGDALSQGSANGCPMSITMKILPP